MRIRTLLATALTAAAALAGYVARAHEPAPAAVPGIRWHKSFDAACAEAQATGKLVLLLQLHGDFEKELC